MSGDNKQRLPAEIAEKFLEIQSKELDVRLKETEIEAGDLDNQKEVALVAIRAQADDRNNSRDLIGKESTKTKIFFVSVLVILCIFILILVGLDQSDMAQKLLEIAFTGCLGAFGGYGYAKWEASQESDD